MFDFIGNICSSSRNTRTVSKQISHMTTSQHQSGNGSVSQNSVSRPISRVSWTQTSVYPHRRNSTQFSHGSAYKSVFLRGHTNISFFYAGILQQDATEPRPRTQTLAYLPSRNSTQGKAGFPGSFVPRLLVPGFRGSILARLRILRRPARAPILQLSSGSGQEAGGCD